MRSSRYQATPRPRPLAAAAGAFRGAHVSSKRRSLRGYRGPVRAAVVAGIALVLAASSAAAHTFVVMGDSRIGGYAVKRDGSLRGAIAAFGDPRLRRMFGRGACRATWSRHGLTIDFYNLGGEDACTPRGGRFSRAVMRGPHWRTSLGLRVGDSTRKLMRLYRDADFRRGTRRFWPSGWWLVRRYSPFGDGAYYPGLLAETRRGVVIALHVRYAAGGD